MKCPTCTDNTTDDWHPFYVTGPHGGKFETYMEGPTAAAKEVALDWMRCANPECRELVIRVHESYRTFVHGVPIQQHTNSWFARPRVTNRAPVDSLVPEEFRRDYAEAAAILDLSPRMSAVMSRRILADLLERYASQDQFHLNARIEKFAKDTAHPSHLRENLHHFREVADFGAHTQKDDQAQIIDVDKAEAEWTLDLLDRLFDHFIVAPAKDKKMRESMDEKIKKARRKPVPPLPDDKESS